MAKRGSTKSLSVKHEEEIAKFYGGRRSPSSGASATDQGDVRATEDGSLFECKYKGSPTSPLKSKPTLVSVMEKIADEAWSGGYEPAMALRYFCPDSPLANREGWVDLSVRLTNDDSVRSQLILDLAERANNGN